MTGTVSYFLSTSVLYSTQVLWRGEVEENKKNFTEGRSLLLTPPSRVQVKNDKEKKGLGIQEQRRPTSLFFCKILGKKSISEFLHGAQRFQELFRPWWKLSGGVSPARVAQSCPTLCDPNGLWGPLSMGFSRQEYWSGLSFPSPEDIPDPGTETGSPALQADSLPSEPKEWVCVDI